MGALAGGPLCSGWGPRQNRSTDPLFRIGKSCLAVTPGTGPEGTDGAPETEAQGGAAEPWMGRVEIGARGHCGRDWHLRGRQQTGRHHTPGRGVGRCQPRRARGLQLHQACSCGSGAQERPRPDRGRARVARVVRVASRAGGSGPSPSGGPHYPPARQGHPPPVPVELAVSKLHELGHGVQAGVEEPVEEDEPDEVVGDLWGVGARCQNSPTRPYASPPSRPLTASFRRRSTMRE